MYLKKGKIIHMRKRGEDWHEIVGSSPNIMGLRFPSPFLSHRFSFPLPFSFSLCLVIRIIVNQRPYRFCLRLSRYIGKTGVILLAREKARRDARVCISEPATQGTEGGGWFFHPHAFHVRVYTRNERDWNSF